MVCPRYQLTAWGFLWQHEAGSLHFKNWENIYQYIILSDEELVKQWHFCYRKLKFTILNYFFFRLVWSNRLTCNRQQSHVGEARSISDRGAQQANFLHFKTTLTQKSHSSFNRLLSFRTISVLFLTLYFWAKVVLWRWLLRVQGSVLRYSQINKLNQTK